MIRSYNGKLFEVTEESDPKIVVKDLIKIIPEKSIRNEIKKYGKTIAPQDIEIELDGKYPEFLQSLYVATYHAKVLFKSSHIEAVETFKSLGVS